jgi:hypothetical protein
MTQVNNNGFNNINGVSSNTSSGQQSIPVQKNSAPGSGQAGFSGVSPNAGLARIGLTQDTQVSDTLAKADQSPTREGLSSLALAVIFGPQAAKAAKILLPGHASDSDRAVLAGALTTTDYGLAA